MATTHTKIKKLFPQAVDLLWSLTGRKAAGTQTAGDLMRSYKKAPNKTGWRARYSTRDQKGEQVIVPDFRGENLLSGDDFLRIIGGQRMTRQRIEQLDKINRMTAARLQYRIENAQTIGDQDAFRDLTHQDYERINENYYSA